MTDPRDAMLNAARALHDRNPNDPRTCPTCTTEMNPIEWPCPTATALGATGRSEWTTPTPEPAEHEETMRRRLTTLPNGTLTITTGSERCFGEPCTRGCPHDTTNS
jgi:hypothetical protein